MAANSSSYQPYLRRSSPVIEDKRRLEELLSEQTAVASLPPDLKDFVGRQGEMQQAIVLWRQLCAASGIVPVLSIVGSTGVGKSAFAQRLVKRIRPPAQLYLDLRNHLSVSSAAIMQQVQNARAMADNVQLLILLDNLGDQTLIHPILTLGDRCALLVTSRQPLVTATEPATATATLELSALSDLDAIALLQSIVKSKPIQVDREIGHSIVRCCDALPLALRIVGGTLQTQPQLQLSDCLQQLSTERQRCEQAHLSDPAIRASFNLSYQYLDARSTCLLRLLGLLPEPNVTLKTAAVLAETSIYFVRNSIAHLLQARLLESTGDERHRLPDVLRRLAKSQLAIEESAETRQAARLRLCQSYQESAEVMSLGLDANSCQQLARLYGRGRSDFEQSLLLRAQNWFAIEQPNLLIALDWAFQAEAWAIGLDIVQHLTSYLALRGEWAEGETMLLRALSITEKLADRLSIAQLLNSLGNIYLQQGEWEKAKLPYQQSLEILRALQEPMRESQTLTNLGIVYLEQGNCETAAVLWAEALTRSLTGSTRDQDLMEWMQTANKALLETVLLQLDDRHPSHKFLDAIGGIFKRLLS